VNVTEPVGVVEVDVVVETGAVVEVVVVFVVVMLDVVDVLFGVDVEEVVVLEAPPPQAVRTRDNIISTARGRNHFLTIVKLLFSFQYCF
jgi:hypothetical protein